MIKKLLVKYYITPSTKIFLLKKEKKL